MEASEWIGLAALLVMVLGALIGALWLWVRGDISSAHQRLDRHVATHSQFREEVLSGFGSMREKLASEYVRRDDLKERLSEVLEPLHRDNKAQKRQLDRIENFQVRLMERLHIPAVSEEPES